MKKQLSGSVVILFSLLLFQTGCLVKPPKHNMDATFKKALQLESTGTFYYKEDEMDSAIKSFTSSQVLFKDLADSTTPPKDTLYMQHIAYLYSLLSCVYDSLHNYDSALAFDLKSLHWITKGTNELENREILNHAIAHNYKTLGDKKGNKTDSGKAFYHKGLPYVLTACWEIDSLGDRTYSAVRTYYLAMEMYRVTGDTAREKFYKNKYNNLNIILHLQSDDNTSDKTGSQLSKKTITNPKKTDTSFKSRFLNAFERGFEKGWNKHHTNSGNNSDNASVTTNTNSDGTTTTTITTISNGVETITTEVNGVVVKKETKKI